MPKGWASKLVPQFIGPYKVKEAYPSTSDYELDLPPELAKQNLHGRFHVNLLRPHHANDVLFPSRTLPEPYNFGAPSNAEWYVDEITGHRWQGWNIQFQVKWNLGDSTWEPLHNCNDLAALDNYLMLMNVKEWQNLPQHATRVAQSVQRNRYK
jgi:hypothetical protein